MITALLMLGTAATAQVFLQKEKGDISPRNTSGSGGQEWIIVPIQGMDIDQYAATPLGSGVVLMTLLGGAYALTKRKKKK